jgi:transcriptional regulator with PAS, ATPase and Fis domain
MVSLTHISEYVSQTASIIGGVLDLDVLIVDDSLLIVGDSDLESVATDECIRQDSILARVMAEKQYRILNSKDDHAGCLSCNKRDRCVVEMIIGIPIFCEDKVIGSIGIIANTQADKEKMINEQDNYLKFIDRMIELLINKLRENQAFEEISLLKKRMEVVLDSIDHFLILVSKDGEILQTNFDFRKIFKRKVPKNLNDFFDTDFVNSVLNNTTEIKYKEVKIDKKHDFIVSSKPVILDQKDHGAILNFRSVKDVAVEMNELYNHSMDVAFDDLVGESSQINDIKERIKQIASSSSTVLIDGETGTGKEVIARLIHNTSKRSQEPFVAINCSAIPEDLMESELFGYEEGAFSGAKKGGKLGKFQLADGGTIFLDEIGEMALHLQAKLLRVLQERQISKIGGLESIDVNVRILAATNKKLEDLVKQGRFREDLYYRLKVIPITSPPLRERVEDIKLLIDYFINYYANKIDTKINGITEDALQVLLSHPWKGNVRELRNVIEFSINMTNSDMITLNALPFDLLHPVTHVSEDLNIEVHMKVLIEKALAKYGETTIAKEMAAKALGISVATLYRRMKEFGLK